jgi:signal transduction histidine kinase
MVLVAVFVVALVGIVVGRGDHRDRWPPPPRGAEPALVEQQLLRDLADYYRREQNWAGSDRLLLAAQAQEFLDQDFRRTPAFFLTDTNRTVIYHLKSDRIGQPLRPVKGTVLSPIRVGDQTVGYLGSAPFVTLLPDGPPDFVVLLGRSLLTAAVVAGLGGILFGIFMSRSLTAPLNNLAAAARDIGARNLSRRVEERGSDEMVAVARAFNEMAADLEESEQLRRNLLADTAHELRTPLSVLQGNLRAILDEVYPMNQEEMVRLYDHTRFLSRLVNDLHELAQAEARQLPLDLQPTDLAHLVQTTTDTFRPSAEAKGVALKTDLPAGLPPCPVDSARLTQVLQNLLANALRHTPTAGAITVRAESGATTVTLSIEDTGEGIPSEHLPYVFDRFYRTDPARSRDRGGAGLGLAIARAIVEAHGGQISVASEGVSGRGSTFTIQLPVVSQ